MPDPPPIRRNRLDLNCDLGEGEAVAMTAALMDDITSANIACGGHAGDEGSIRLGIELAQARGVHVGAHPGLPASFGRGGSLPSPSELEALLEDQVGRFLAAAAAAHAPVHHLKLHGSLYHATERDPALQDVLITFMVATIPHAILYALAGGTTVSAARAAGLQSWDEAFADRAYRADGSLVPRSNPCAVLTDPSAVVARVEALTAGRPIPSVTGSPLLLPVQTVCLHGDSPGSLSLLRAIKMFFAA